MSGKKSTIKDKVKAPPKPEEPQLQATPTEALPTPQEEAIPTPIPEPTPAPTPTPKSTPTLTVKQLSQELLSLRQLVEEHSHLLIQIQETLARKRKPVTSNGKVQIKDKQTGTIYPSKNNAYQTLLKSGELKALVDKGVFGPVPEKNTFGWYTLVREWPDRFEEVATSPK